MMTHLKTSSSYAALQFFYGVLAFSTNSFHLLLSWARVFQFGTFNFCIQPYVCIPFNTLWSLSINPSGIYWLRLSGSWIFPGLGGWPHSQPPNLEDQGLFCQGYHNLTEKSGFKVPDAHLHPPILWWVGFDGYAGQLPAWAFPAIFRDTCSSLKTEVSVDEHVEWHYHSFKFHFFCTPTA